MKQLIIIKIGGSTITHKDKPFTLNSRVMKKIVKDLAEIWKQGKYSIILGNGGGSFAHTMALKYKEDIVKGGLDPLGFSQIQNAAAKLNRILVEELIKEKIPAVSINPSSAAIAQKKDIKTWDLSPIIHTLEKNALPVVYGDIIWKEKKGATIMSTEKIIQYIAYKLTKEKYSIEKVIFLTNIDGVKDKWGKTIPQMTQNSWREIEPELYSIANKDVTGGMKHKIIESLQIALLSKEVIITQEKNLKDVIEGKKRGTKIINE